MRSSRNKQFSRLGSGDLQDCVHASGTSGENCWAGSLSCLSVNVSTVRLQSDTPGSGRTAEQPGNRVHRTP